jgi:hypothetical protein
VFCSRADPTGTGIERSEVDDFIEDTGLMELEGIPIESMAS